MERYHEILRPIKDIANSIGERILNSIVPRDALNMGLQEESIKRTAPIEDPFGWDVVAPQPDLDKFWEEHNADIRNADV